MDAGFVKREAESIAKELSGFAGKYPICQEGLQR